MNQILKLHRPRVGSDHPEILRTWPGLSSLVQSDKCSVVSFSAWKSDSFLDFKNFQILKLPNCQAIQCWLSLSEIQGLASFGWSWAKTTSAAGAQQYKGGTSNVKMIVISHAHWQTVLVLCLTVSMSFASRYVYSGFGLDKQFPNSGSLLPQHWCACGCCGCSVGMASRHLTCWLHYGSVTIFVRMKKQTCNNCWTLRMLLMKEGGQVLEWCLSSRCSILPRSWGFWHLLVPISSNLISALLVYNLTKRLYSDCLAKFAFKLLCTTLVWLCIQQKMVCHVTV